MLWYNKLKSGCKRNTKFLSQNTYGAIQFLLLVRLLFFTDCNFQNLAKNTDVLFGPYLDMRGSKQYRPHQLYTRHLYLAMKMS